MADREPVGALSFANAMGVECPRCGTRAALHRLGSTNLYCLEVERRGKVNTKWRKAVAIRPVTIYLAPVDVLVVAPFPRAVVSALTMGLNEYIDPPTEGEQLTLNE
jgi:hypothetical protein